ncbi:MAG: CocE/NonD family hydrolase [Pseudomonadota bacterium]
MGKAEINIHPDMGIELADGTRLSARVWMPSAAETTPLPAILEYLPYRKTDGTVERDDPMHLHFAQHGYVSVRVDRRGCGDSEGLFDDEYSEQELADGEDIIAWIAAQPWCNGNVGIQGISWGGFNGLQIAARRPEALKAVITIGSTVDRYADDIHYKGGVQLCENIGWAATAMSWFSMPPDPGLVGDDWREMWHARLEQTPFLAATWTRHKDRDAYWRHGSICEDYSAINAPVLAMGGLHDGYRNTMAHLVENLASPAYGIAGPWNHKYPHISGIAPAISYLEIAVRWWDRWLKGIKNGVDDEPAYRAYVMDSVIPSTTLTHRPGRWIAEPAWPSPDITQERMGFGPGTLGTGEPVPTLVPYDLTCGQNCGEYFPFGFGAGELPDRQDADDARSACFDSQPLQADWDIVGAPVVDLRIASSAPHGQVIVRLCDVFPDGTSALICLGILNLKHRGGFDRAVDLQPGQIYDISLTLDQSAYRVPAGHRLRVAVSSSYWPYCWPDGRPFALTIHGGALSCPKRMTQGDQISFPPAFEMEPRPQKTLRPPRDDKRTVTKGDQIELTIFGDHGCIEDLVTGLINESDVTETWTIDRADPASAHARIIWNRSLSRAGEFAVSTRVVSDMWGRDSHFEIRQTLEAWDSDKMVFETTFHDKIDR